MSLLLNEEFVTDSKTSHVKKKVYTKPKVTEIQLVAQEAVLSVCKDGAMGVCTPDLTCSDFPRS